MTATNIWPEKTLDEVCLKITDGAHHSPKSVDVGLPMASVKDLTRFGLNLDTARRISTEDYQQLVRQGCQPLRGDVLIAKDGATALDTVCEIRTAVEAVLLSSVAILRPDPAEVTPSFLRYFLDSPTTRSSMKTAFTTGAAIPRVVLKDFKRATIKVPPLPTQRRIASILSAYDDLIENNTRRIAILEEMARNIYEEWFVRFRFPGHEQVKMVESELGAIPEGWRHHPLGDLLDHHIGGGWGEETQSDEFPVAAYVIRGTDIPDVRTSSLGRAPLRFHKESNFRSRKLLPRDIVFEVSGGSKDQPVGRSVFLGNKLFSTTDQPLICASFCRLIRANRSLIAPELLQLHFERIYENREIMKYQTQSTGITNFKFAVFLEKEHVLVPPTKVQDDFDRCVSPLLELAGTLGVKNLNLRATRDLLLPKLISGKIDVSNLAA